MTSRRQPQRVGLNVEKIADETGMGIDTVRGHLRHARKKLGAINDTRAVGLALRQDLI